MTASLHLVLVGNCQDDHAKVELSDGREVTIKRGESFMLCHAGEIAKENPIVKVNLKHEGSFVADQEVCTIERVTEVIPDKTET